jgi:hypothetical protein
MGLGQSFDGLRARRCGAVRQSERKGYWLDRGCWGRLRVYRQRFGRIEYRYTSLATTGFVSIATNAAEALNRVPINDLRAGIAYKFGGRSDTIKF